MCLLIASAIYFAAYNFFMNGFMVQAIMSAVFATLLLSFFTYRMIKNRRCIFGDKDDCNRSSNEEILDKS